MKRSLLLILPLTLDDFSNAFVVPSNGRVSHRIQQRNILRLQATAEEVKHFDDLLAENKLKQAADLFRQSPDLELTRDRWNRIFDTIEEVTTDADQASINTRRELESPLLSKSRMEMTDMYSTLQKEGHLRLFGSISKYNMPANGSHSVRPDMLEQITSLSMKALTPRPSNTLLYAGAALALLEGIVSANFGLDLNVLFFATLVSFLGDKALLNGALSESLMKALSPKTQPKITRHEAGHFLCAYLLGCPVEGYVLSAWGALQDPRFGSMGVSAGTSFFDPVLSSQIASTKITRSSIDRYSIIVMAGIAAEAVNYGQADGGAGDEMALISFLANLNGSSSSSSNPAWNDITIRNQARWGALQAVLIIREYKECYDALVDTLERGGSLGDCIYAIENAGREHNKLPLKKPLGYIVEKGAAEEWVKELPEAEQARVGVSQTAEKPKSLDPEESLEALKSYKGMAQARLKEIEEQLNALD
eukprot:scaffold5024_cov136-Cylindrotheca_fusiformis.AAC.42